MADSKQRPSQAPDSDDDHLPDVGDALPPLDFTTFILSLSTSAMASLGELPGPDGEQTTDLPLARQTIDLIDLLRVKTHGNLTGEEERLLNQVLLDLRMRFVHVAGASGTR